MSEQIIKSIQFLNPWWEKEPIPSHLLPEFERPQLKNIMSYEGLGRIVVVKGPRRVGKTTLIYQYISKLLKKRVKPDSIMFLSMDDPALRVPIRELMDTKTSILGTDINPKVKQYLFLDEIQFLENWAEMLKVITDRNKNLHVVVSGSSASLLGKTSESLAGRTIEENLFPFSPLEVALWNKRKNIPKWIKANKTPSLLEPNKFWNPKALRYQNSFEFYLRGFFKYGGFPHLFNITDPTMRLSLMRSDIIEKAIYRDISSLYGVKDPLVLEKLFLYFVDVTSNIANNSSISTQLKIGRETLSQYVNYLKSSFLLFSLPKYSRYPKEVLKSQEKIHIIDSGLYSLVNPNGDNINSSGKLTESLIASLIFRKKDSRVYYWKDNYEVDLVMEKERHLIPIEVKTQNLLYREKHYRGLFNFMETYKTEFGYVFYNGPYHEEKTDIGTIFFVPVWYAAFCL